MSVGLCKTIGVWVYVSLVAVAAAQAQSIYGDPVPFSDWSGPVTLRSLGNGLTQNPATMYANPSLTWHIVPEGDFLRYTYTFTGLGARRFGLSHVVIDISDDALSGSVLADPLAIFDLMVNGQPPDELEFTTASFPHESQITGGLKFGDFEQTSGDYTVSFLSSRMPVWGHFGIKAGQTGSLHNTAYGSSDLVILTNKINFIARPNGLVSEANIPEPSSLAVLLGTSLALLRRRTAPARS